MSEILGGDVTGKTVESAIPIQSETDNMDVLIDVVRDLIASGIQDPKTLTATQQAGIDMQREALASLGGQKAADRRLEWFKAIDTSSEKLIDTPASQRLHEAQILTSLGLGGDISMGPASTAKSDYQEAIGETYRNVMGGDNPLMDRSHAVSDSALTDVRGRRASKLKHEQATELMQMQIDALQDSVSPGGDRRGHRMIVDPFRSVYA